MGHGPALTAPFQLLVHSSFKCNRDRSSSGISERFHSGGVLRCGALLVLCSVSVLLLAFRPCCSLQSGPQLPATVRCRLDQACCHRCAAAHATRVHWGAQSTHPNTERNTQQHSATQLAKLARESASAKQCLHLMRGSDSGLRKPHARWPDDDSSSDLLSMHWTTRHTSDEHEFHARRDHSLSSRGGGDRTPGVNIHTDAGRRIPPDHWRPVDRCRRILRTGPDGSRWRLCGQRREWTRLVHSPDGCRLVGRMDHDLRATGRRTMGVHAAANISERC